MAQWKKVIVSGSNAELNEITGSKLQLTNVPISTTVTTPLVIDSDGNVSSGSAYALAAGGNTVGGESLATNVVIIGSDNGSLITTASDGGEVDFNNALTVKGIQNLSASGTSSAAIGIFETLSIGDSTHSIAFISKSDGTLNIPASESNGFAQLEIGIPVTMSNVPDDDNTLTDILVIGSDGGVHKRPSSELGGVTTVTGGTNLSNNTLTTGDVTLDLDSSLTSLTSVQTTNITSSGIISASIISASNIKISGGLDADGDITLDGTLAFNGFNFSETNIASLGTGSTLFGSGSLTASLISHSFTGSILATGSTFSFIGGPLAIEGISNVSQSIYDITSGTDDHNAVTFATFNPFSESIANTSSLFEFTQSLKDFISGSDVLNSSSLSYFFGLTSSFVALLNATSSFVVTGSTGANSIHSLIQTNSFTLTSSFHQFTSSYDTFSSSVASTLNGLADSDEVDHLQDSQSNFDTAFDLSGTNVTIAGNLSVLGNTTTISTQDLIVEDRYIFIGSGSSTIGGSAVDVGIIFNSGSGTGTGGDQLNTGRGIIFDAGTNRFTTTINMDSDQGSESDIADNQRTGDIVTVKTGQTSPPSSSASSSFGEGEMYIDNNNDIYIYVEG
jgi:hypothetical protein